VTTYNTVYRVAQKVNHCGVIIKSYIRQRIDFFIKFECKRSTVGLIYLCCAWPILWLHQLPVSEAEFDKKSNLIDN